MNRMVGFSFSSTVLQFNLFFFSEFSRRSIGSRFVLHKYLNQFIQRLVLPAVDLRVSRTHSLSTASLLTSAKDLLFRNTKISELNRVLDLSAQRSADDPSPEISLDPLESIEGKYIVLILKLNPYLNF